MESVAAVFLTPIITGLIVWFIERSRAKKDAIKEEAEEINAEVNVATMELAYATAMAVKRGQPNGEVEDAVKAYNAAKKRMDQFNEKMKNKMI